MAFTCGFFNSQNGDRKYNAEQMASIFDGLIKDGVYDTIGEIFAVTPGTGMQVLVGSGRAWFDHTWNNNDAPYPLAITAADVSLPRYDAVVLETNHSDTVRTNRLRVLTGTPASTPIKPTMTSTANVKQHPLAYIKVTAGATAITQSMIEVVVGTSECPFVTGIIETAQIDALFQQWNGEFDAWFENLKAQLSDNVVANLQKQIDQKVAKADVATTADIEAGTSTTKWVSPKGLKESGVTNTVKDLTSGKNGYVTTQMDVRYQQCPVSSEVFNQSGVDPFVVSDSNYYIFSMRQVSSGSTYDLARVLVMDKDYSNSKTFSFSGVNGIINSQNIGEYPVVLITTSARTTYIVDVPNRNAFSMGDSYGSTQPFSGDNYVGYCTIQNYSVRRIVVFNRSTHGSKVYDLGPALNRNSYYPTVLGCVHDTLYYLDRDDSQTRYLYLHQINLADGTKQSFPIFSTSQNVQGIILLGLYNNKIYMALRSTGGTSNKVVILDRAAATFSNFSINETPIYINNPSFSSLVLGITNGRLYTVDRVNDNLCEVNVDDGSYRHITFPPRSLTSILYDGYSSRSYTPPIFDGIYAGVLLVAAGYIDTRDYTVHQHSPYVKAGTNFDPQSAAGTCGIDSYCRGRIDSETIVSWASPNIVGISAQRIDSFKPKE